ncbi:MAG TPA: cache domain-containing protein [Terriglobales bacterium]|nr:cache domain-containing protein [Terriglobales bacterium]
MNHRQLLVVLGLALLVFGVTRGATAEEKATPQEIINKVQEAASVLAKSAEAKPARAALEQFDQKQGPWVWKDTYIFVVDCGQAIIAAHPMNPELIGKEALSLLDTKGHPFFWQVCDALKKPSGIWLQYWWPKPGQKEGSRKISYALRAGNTPYVVGAGVYDDKATIADLEKLTRRAK